MIDQDILDLAAAYQAETALPLHVCAALVSADIEPSLRHTRAGFSARESGVITDFYAKYDPHGSKQEAVAFAV